MQEPQKDVCVAHWRKVSIAWSSIIGRCDAEAGEVGEAGVAGVWENFWAGCEDHDPGIVRGPGVVCEY